MQEAARTMEEFAAWESGQQERRGGDRPTRAARARAEEAQEEEEEEEEEEGEIPAASSPSKRLHPQLARGALRQVHFRQPGPGTPTTSSTYPWHRK